MHPKNVSSGAGDGGRTYLPSSFPVIPDTVQFCLRSEHTVLLQFGVHRPDLLLVLCTDTAEEPVATSTRTTVPAAVGTLAPNMFMPFVAQIISVDQVDCVDRVDIW